MFKFWRQRVVSADVIFNKKLHLWLVSKQFLVLPSLLESCYFLFSFALFITIFGEVFGRAGVYMARDITGYVCGCVWFYCGVGFRVRMPVSRILYLRFFAYLCNWTEHRQSESEPQRGGSGDVFHRARVPLPAPPVGAFICAAAYYIFASAAPGRVTTFDSWRKRRP